MYATAIAIMLMTGPTRPLSGRPPTVGAVKLAAKPSRPSDADARRKIARARARAGNARLLATMDAALAASLASADQGSAGPPAGQWEPGLSGGGSSADPTMFSLPHQYMALFQKAQATVTAANSAMT